MFCHVCCGVLCHECCFVLCHECCGVLCQVCCEQCVVSGMESVMDIRKITEGTKGFYDFPKQGLFLNYHI